MDNQTIVIIAAVLVALTLLILRFALRRQRVSLGEQPVATEKRRFGPRDVAAPMPVAGDATLEAATFAAAVAPPTPEELDADPLTIIKGLGPKAAAQLNALGITRFADLARLNEAEVAALDEAMGTFKGRIVRDRWIEQAHLLANDDRAGFEERFGRIG